MKISFIIVFTLCCFSLLAQNKRDNQLLFGERRAVVMDFSTGDPILNRYDTDLRLSGANASICDKEGNLLLYTNGCKIFNKDFQTMANGDSISHHYLRDGYCDGNGVSPLQQGALILPMPSSDSLYMVLYNDLEDLFFNTSYFRLTTGAIYSSIIDMSLDGGNGEVIEKNTVVLKDSLARNGLQAYQHTNNIDWWIIYPESHTNCMYIMLLTEEGITNIDKQCIGHEWTDDDLPAQCTFSPNGKKYCRFNYYNGLNIYDFDASNGELSNPLNIDFQDIGPPSLGWNGAQFSPNSRYIYATAYKKIFQLDLHEEDIAASRVLLAEFNHPDDILFQTKFHNAFLGPNGKIYIGGTNQWNHLHVIHNPNCKGLSSNFEQYALRLDTLPGFSTSGVPNFPHFRIQTEESECDTTFTDSADFLVDPNISLKLFPNPSTGIINVDIDSPLELPSISFFDTAGQLVFNSDLSEGSNTISLVNLESGMYFYKVYEHLNHVASGRIIINRE